MPSNRLLTLFQRKPVWVDLTIFSMIALFTAVLFYALLLSYLKDSEHNAYWINVSGKQRMLSQAIAIDVFRLHQLQIDSAQPVKPKEVIQQRLQQSIIMVRHHIQLLTENAPHNAELEQLYYQNHLIAELNCYLDLAEQFNLAPQDRDLFNLINQQTTPLLGKLDQAVTQYQLISEQAISRLKQLKNEVWYLIAFMLLLQLTVTVLPILARERRLKKQASHDPLTGLLNRLNLEQNITDAITQHIDKQTAFAVLALDIDFFKQVNDTYGHKVGDEFLRYLSEMMKTHLRSTDTIYRAGGEEFVILLDNISLEHAQIKAEEIRANLEKQPFKFEKITLNNTISIGLFHPCNANCCTASDALNLADHALYCSKNSGRNQVTVYHPNLNCLHNK